ncbi:FimV/HubP family polar landmark protein, partial [Pseudoalteromonas sp. S1649]|uniref:FimV/HubP family polar landmark protein n=2 Tax=unclassified Pseudoalteromonas TaxID=194690 RepID=UPI001280CE6D
DDLIDEDELDDALDVDDIDSLLDEAQEEPESEELVEESIEEPSVDDLIDEDELDHDLDVDDIDSLLDEDASDEQDSDVDDELEELIQQTNELKQDTEAQISDLSHEQSDSAEHDENLQESLEDLADADQAVDDMNVESIASELVDDADDSDEVDIDEALNQEFNEDSDELLDEDDSLDEFDDPSLKSVDELLNEIGEEDDYVEAPDWSIDEPEQGIEEVEIDLGDDPLADEDLTDEFDLTADEEPLQQDTVTPSQELEEYPELELDEAGFELDESDEDTSNELDEDAPLQLSQAEQDLANSLATGNELDQLDDDFDDEILLDNEFTEDDVLDPEDDLSDQSQSEGTTELTSEAPIDDEVADSQDELEEFPEFELDDIELDDAREAEQTLADIESNLSDEADLSELSDDEIDDDFMADLTQTDFDALLNELAEPDEADISDASEFDVDFNALLNEDLQGESEQPVAPEVQALDTEEQTTSTDEFVDIDSLLEQSDDEALDHEPYDEVDMDVGLSDFNDLLAGDNPTDVDAESGGYSAKLDLARAYIEIDDFDAALQAIEDVIANGPEEVQEEAQSLKAKISE